MLHRVLRVLSGLLCPFFVFSVVVQYNDPDPLRWMAVYGAAALISGRAAWRGRVPLWLPIAVGLVALGWAAAIAPEVLGRVRISEMFAEFHMTQPLVEEARETGGLLFVAGGMLFALLTTVTRPVGQPKPQA